MDQFSPGGVLDKLMHNITNGHVVHHLVFTKIPHYNLSKVEINHMLANSLSLLPAHAKMHSNYHTI